MSVIAARHRPQSTERYHWSVETFYRAISAGVFDEPNRLELVQGELWEMEPMNPPHARLIEDIANILREHLQARFWIREEKPFHIAWDGEPVPDIALVLPSARESRDRHPRSDEIQLVIEIADTSVYRDTHEKAMLYAQAGIADYWVSLIPTRELLVFRSPTSEGYLESVRLSETDHIHPLAAPDVEFAVRDLTVPISSSTTENAAD